MAAVMSILGNAVNAGLGIENKSSLEDFLGKYSDPGQKYVNTLDPLGTFDVTFSFYPREKPSGSKGKGFGAAMSSLAKDLKSAGNNALDSITGGLYSSLTTDGDVVAKQHNEYGKARHESFVQYLAKAHDLTDGGLDLDLSLYVQSITVPNMRMDGGQKASSLLGDFPVNSGLVQTDGTLQMTFVNTKAALHERLFYPWMREVTLPYWSYGEQPYTTAKVVVDYTKHNDVQYVFTGVRPTQVNMLQGTQAYDSSNLMREVSFVFDFMFVTSSLKTVDSAKDKVLGSLGSLAGGAGGVIGL